MFTFIYNVFTRSIIVLLVAMLSVNYLPESLFHDFPFDPKSVEPVDYDAAKPQQWNNLLSDNNPEFIQLNQILGPESIAISSSGLWYTGLADGRLVELDPSNSYKLRQVCRVRASPQCEVNVATRADVCGRFLQLRFMNNSLYALDSSTGLYKVDTAKGSKTYLGPTKPLHKINMYNSFAFDPVEPNIVYLTLSSSKWHLLRITWSFLESDTSGELIAFDISTGKRVVMLSNLQIANGVDVDPKRNQLLLVELMRSRVHSINLDDLRASFKNANDGEKVSVRTKPLIPIMPGSPDNIIVHGDKAYIALPFVKPNGKEFTDVLATMPNIRKAIGRFIYGLGTLLEYVCENLYRHPLLESTYREMRSGHTIYRLTNNDRSAVLEYDLATGASRLFGSNTFSFVSEAVPDDKGNLILGSFRSPFIVKVKI